MTYMTGPAPALDCARCHRTIAKNGGHYLIEGDRVVCGRLVRGQHACLSPAAHRELFPDCPTGWHDALDHLVSTGTRAGIAAKLRLWPARKAAKS